MQYIKILLLAISGLILVACGGGGGSGSNVGGGGTPTGGGGLGTTRILTDSPIDGVSYNCDGVIRTTSNGGEFTCQSAPVTFSIGDLELGTIRGTFPADNKIFPQDLAGTTRDDLTGKALRIARLLQSLDDDGTITHTIQIHQNAASRFTGNNLNFDTNTDANLQALFNLFGGSRGLIDANEAASNLRANMYSIIINLANASATATIDTDVVLNFSGADIIDNTGSQVNQITLMRNHSKTVTVFLIDDPSSDQALSITTRATGFEDSGTQAILSPNRRIYTVNLNLVSTESGQVAPGVMVANSDVSSQISGAGMTSETITITNQQASSSITIEIPSGTMLTDRDDNPVDGAMLRVTSFDPNQQQALAAYPGGLNVMAEVGGLMINGVTQTAGTEAQVSFKSAGFVAITITDENGNKVRNFSQPVEVAMQFPIDTTDENNQAISVGDSVPIWSYDEDTGQWTYESEGLVTDQDTSDGLFDVIYSVTHLSYYNLDWFVPPEIDTDGDGIPNRLDDDIDGDGISNEQDSDDDGDGIPDNNDNDSNGDGSTDTDDDNRVYNCTSIFELEDGLGNRDYDPYNFELSIPSAGIYRTYNFNRGAFIAFPFVRSVPGSLTITTQTGSLVEAISVSNFCEPAIRQVTTRLARENINIGADRNVSTDADLTIATQVVTDSECGRTLTYTTSNPSIASVDTNTAVVSVVAAGTASITANAEQNNRCEAASDDYLLTINLNPVVSSSVTATVDEDDGSSFSVSLSASDTTGNTLTWSLALNASSGTATVTGTGSPVITYVPVDDFNGTDSFSAQVSDGIGGSATVVINVTITAVNDSPTFTSSPITNATEDSAYSYTASATDVDGDNLSFALTSPSPSWLGLSGATLSGTPSNTDVGTHSVIISVTDDGSPNLIAQQSFIITVTNTNDAPTIDQGDSVSVMMSEDGTPTAFVAPSITVTDVDVGDSLTWSLETQASSGTAVVSGTGSSPNITYTPTTNFNGVDSFIVQVSDGVGGSATVVINVTINAVDDAPTLELERTTILAASVDNAYTLTITAQDVEGDALSFAIENRPSWASFNTATATATATLTGTPSSGDVGEFSNILISVMANGVTTTLPTFSITVDAQPPKPAVWGEFNWNDGDTWQ